MSIYTKASEPGRQYVTTTKRRRQEGRLDQCVRKFYTRHYGGDQARWAMKLSLDDTLTLGGLLEEEVEGIRMLWRAGA